MHDTSTAAGRLEAIWIKRVRRGPMDARPSAVTVAGSGLQGNVEQKGKRQVTILDAARWADVEAELGREVDPRTRRANLMVSGIDLEQSRGKTLHVGACRIAILGETRPCRLMDDAEPGLQQALDPHWRAGAYGQILDDAEIHVGDAVRLVDKPKGD